MPFTDAWYLRARRMLHASQVWHLHKRFAGDGRSPGRTLIDVLRVLHATGEETVARLDPYLSRPRPSP